LKEAQPGLFLQRTGFDCASFFIRMERQPSRINKQINHHQGVLQLMTSNTNEINSAQDTEEQKSSSPDNNQAGTSPLFVESAKSSPAPRARKTFAHRVEAERALW